MRDAGVVKVGMMDVPGKSQVSRVVLPEDLGCL